MAELQGMFNQLGLAQHHIKPCDTFNLRSVCPVTPDHVADATGRNLGQHRRHCARWEQNTAQTDHAHTGNVTKFNKVKTYSTTKALFTNFMT